MNEIFTKGLKLVLLNEGGYINHPNDKGGETNKGITQGTYNSYLKQNNIFNKSVKYITDYEVKDIYYNKYWIRGKCNLLQPKLSIVHFDTIVNWGITGGNKILQYVLNVKVDGIIGPKTIEIANNVDDLEIANKYCDYRIERRYKIVKNNPSQQVFLKGWINRDKRVKNFINTEI